MFIVRSEKGCLKLNTLTDYNENSYFVGFSNEPQTFFSSEYRAEIMANQCGLTNFIIKKT